MCDCLYAKPNTQTEIQTIQTKRSGVVQPRKSITLRARSSQQSERVRETRIIETRDVFNTNSTYKANLKARIQQTREWNKRHLIRPEVNGFIKIDHSSYLGD